MTRIILKNSKVASKRPSPAALQDGELALNCGDYNDALGLYFRTSATELVKVGPPWISDNPPNASPAGWPGLCTGELWYKPSGTDKGLRIWDGSTWQLTTGLDGYTDSSLTALGVEAGATARSVTGGGDAPLFIGYQAGKAMDARIASIGIGNQALLKATKTSTNNVAIGDQALSNITGTASYNTIIGYQAGKNVAYASNLVAVGSRALQNAYEAASTSVAIGASALQNSTTGVNLAIGAYQGVSITTGTGNVLIGPGHPETGGLTTGSNNIFMGFDTYGIGNASGNMVMANGWRLDTQSNGNVIIGSVPGDSTPNYTLTNNSDNVLIGVMGKNVLGPGANGNTIIGTLSSSFATITTNNNVILGNGNTFALWVNEAGAWGMYNGSPTIPPNFGTPGQILVAQGALSPPTWKTPTILEFTGTNLSGTFTSADNKLITITQGLITAITPL